MKKFGKYSEILSSFYRGTIESILSNGLTVWFGNCSTQDGKALQRVVKTARSMSGVALPSLEDIYHTRVVRRARNILKDLTHPQCRLFKLLPSGGRFFFANAGRYFLSVTTVTVDMLLIVLFVSGALADCPHQPHLFITAPKKMEALSGSCLQIPCSFRFREEQKFISTSKTFGVWIKNDSKFNNKPHNVIFNCSGAVSTYTMSITGNLSERNCTTLFSNLTSTHTDTYFFRVEKETIKATASCDPLQVTVRNSPWRPKITVSGDLKEKESVTITCSAFTPCPHSPPELTWNLQQDSHNKIEENTDGSFTTKIQQTITLSDTHDGKKISCSARYPVNQGEDKTAETEETLNVSYAPKNTSVSISPSDGWVNLTCSSRAKPPVSSFTRFKKSTDGPVRVSEGQIYSFNVTDGGVYYCVASNELDNQTSAEIHVNIEDGNSMVFRLLGGILGFILLICLVIFVWWSKSKHQTQQQTQIQTHEELVVEEPASKREGEEENIHYGEISFSTLGFEVSSDSVQDGGQQQDMVYAQVKVNKPKNSLTQRAHGQEELYAEVKKKKTVNSL
ncbi:sialic acid-binding Ig-like lectin 13 [Archocentrus centrarchus]|uniref:sialic acid-binding Ig-like lectin 13 n=1 Tax=Archocentrus centrarchus TaxID=63155 RepID=UPI0011EA0CB3|nr:sialic acid-binding Ig-like lectin 13 [Archocentrus centrarchus]